jgi:hypothetical protein
MEIEQCNAVCLLFVWCAAFPFARDAEAGGGGPKLGFAHTGVVSRKFGPE